jgi:hypothetical protein
MRLRRRWASAKIKESRAAGSLRELGYEIQGSQVEGSYEVLIDGLAQRVTLRADYVVTREGRTFVAEVKSGEQAPRLSTRATRRQLLEYLVAFPGDGVLLVDAERQAVHHVEFPVLCRSAEAQEGTPRSLGIFITVGFTLAVLAWGLLRWCATAH